MVTVASPFFSDVFPGDFSDTLTRRYAWTHCRRPPHTPSRQSMRVPSALSWHLRGFRRHRLPTPRRPNPSTQRICFCKILHKECLLLFVSKSKGHTVRDVTSHRGRGQDLPMIIFRDPFGSLLVRFAVTVELRMFHLACDPPRTVPTSGDRLRPVRGRFS